MPAPLSHEALARAARAAFGADVAVASVDSLTGDASSRRYVRLKLRGRGAPETAVAMVLGVEQRFGPGADEFAGPIEDTELPCVDRARARASGFHGVESPRAGWPSPPDRLPGRAPRPRRLRPRRAPHRPDDGHARHAAGRAGAARALRTGARCGRSPRDRRLRG